MTIIKSMRSIMMMVIVLMMIVIMIQQWWSKINNLVTWSNHLFIVSSTIFQTGRYLLWWLIHRISSTIPSIKDITVNTSDDDDNDNTNNSSLMTSSSSHLISKVITHLIILCVLFKILLLTLKMWVG